MSLLNERWNRLSALVIAAILIAAGPLAASDLVITGVIDGPLTGGLPKAVEFCATSDIPDLSVYGFGSANNGGGSDGEEFTFPATPVSAGTFLYVASEASGFASFFGFAPGFSSGASEINGDDAIELFMSGTVVDIFGDINVDGTGQPWEHLDGWAYRSDGTGPDGSTFELANWFFSGPNALDGETSNATAAIPFPIGTYPSCTPAVPVPDLLLSEFVVTPTGGEFIEIYNPTAAGVDLSNLYVTDATFAGGGTYYYNIVTGSNAGGGGFGDFHARFPDGASIGPSEFQTVALAGSDGFIAEYGVDPTYELFEDGVAADGVADMREALPGSINNQGGLTNGGEIVVLYAWDGVSDLVADVDYAVWGDKDEAVDKTGVAIDGVDIDDTPSSYLADTSVAAQDVVAPGAHAFGNSFQRVDFAEGVEVQTGGNGVTGSDETSEDLSVTWFEFLPTPGAGPPPPASSWVINEIHADPAGDISGDANGDGIRDGTDDEFVELVNAGAADLDISGWTLADGFSVRHTFPAGSIVPAGCSVVVFGGGVPTGRFGNSLVQTASGGSLGLNNSGDSLTLSDGVADAATANYGSEGGDNQSLTLDPDIVGSLPFVKHSEATGSGGALFSPGTRIDGDQFSGCEALPDPWVINEIHADPAADTPGDANGDGTRDSSADEFVELVNNTGSAMDISGWTLADGFSVRHTFPAGTLVLNGCSVVVFGGGSPTGDFGNSLVQTASDGSLGLNNSGDSVTLNNGVSDVTQATYGGEGGDNQSLTLDPDIAGVPPRVRHTLAAGSNGALFSPGKRVDGSQFAGCPVAAEVFEIQGSGASSPFDGGFVVTRSNVVTALAPSGFFVQTPATRTDFDVDTSDGVFVFTGSAPLVDVGNLVDVIGEVDEFFGFTEIVAATVTAVGTSMLPGSIVFDATVPSSDPAFPSCALEFECYEGMLVEIANGTVTGPNQRFSSDTTAEVYITAAPARTFREPGIEFPGLLGLPVWDGNPEVFELDPDKLGLPNQQIPAGSSFSALGVIGYEFGGYELWPAELSFVPAPLPVSVRPRQAGEFTVGSLNLFRLFDDVDDPADGDRNDAVVSTAEYARRRAKFTSYILDVLKAPDILAVQEAESLQVLMDLAGDIATADPAVVYTAYLEEGNDIGTIDVGFLVRNTIAVDAVTQLGKDELFTFDDPPSPLHDRPPLLLEGRSLREFGSFPIAVMVVHNRSLGGIETERVQRKRFEQAESIAQKVQDMQDTDPSLRLVVTGDFNAFEFTDGYVDAVGIIKGDFEPVDSLVCLSSVCSDLVTPDLLNLVELLVPEDRYSFVFQGSAQALDHALTSARLSAEISGAEFGRGNADAAVDLINDDGSIVAENLPLRSSD
ncbi:MAG: lamin tail domain-containing protein, partial [Acidobacteriota bacterium]|nr:lamin tail domain-containing protein [Acidobacteriota bacterium]